MFSTYAKFTNLRGDKDQSVVTYIREMNWTTAFPQFGWWPEDSPNVGEIWEVMVPDETPGLKSVYVRPIRKLTDKDIVEWKWVRNDGTSSRVWQKSACLIIDPLGKVYRFIGEDIPGSDIPIAKVVKRYAKSHGASHAAYFEGISPIGSHVYMWYQDYDGVFWPQRTWEDAFAKIKYVAPNVDVVSLEAIIRKEWPKEAEKFDVNRRAERSYAVMSIGEGQKEWSWSDAPVKRRQMLLDTICYLVSDFEETIYLFEGRDIPGVCKVLRKQSGRHGTTMYDCFSPTQTTIVQWYQDYDGVFWPQDSWGEAIAWFQSQAPNAKAAAIESIIRQYHPIAAEKFDKHRAALNSFNAPRVEVIHFVEKGRELHSELERLGIIAPQSLKAGIPSAGISELQGDSLVSGIYPMLVLLVGPGGNDRQGFEELSMSGLTVLREQWTRRRGQDFYRSQRRMLFRVNNPDWYYTWLEYKDSKILWYKVANSGGIHTFDGQDSVSTEAWEGIEAETPSLDEIRRLLA